MNGLLTKDGMNRTGVIKRFALWLYQKISTRIVNLSIAPYDVNGHLAKLTDLQRAFQAERLNVS